MPRAGLLHRPPSSGDAVEYLTTQYLYGPGGPALSCSSGAVAMKGRPFVHGFEIYLEKATLTLRVGRHAADACYTPDGKSPVPDLGGGDPVAAFTAEIQTAVDGVARGASRTCSAANWPATHWSCAIANANRCDPDRPSAWADDAGGPQFRCGFRNAEFSCRRTRRDLRSTFMSDASQILMAAEQGDPQAASQLLPLVYAELRQLAAQRLATELPGQTLDATALVHEAYLRLDRGQSRAAVARPRALFRSGRRGHAAHPY